MSKSALTALPPSTPPNQRLLTLIKQLAPHPKAAILDYGAGHGRHSNALRQLGYIVYSYDPHHGLSNINPLLFTSNIHPHHLQLFDISFSAFVLNTLEPQQALNVIYHTEMATKPNGYTVHIVREDLRKLNGGSISTNTYQRDVTIDELSSIGYKRTNGVFYKQRT